VLTVAADEDERMPTSWHELRSPTEFIPKGSPGLNPNEVAAKATSRGNRTTPSRGNQKSLYLVMYWRRDRAKFSCRAQEERYVDEIMRGLQSTVAQIPVVRFSALSMWMDLVGGRSSRAKQGPGPGIHEIKENGLWQE
jgi:hypothetical protein